MAGSIDLATALLGFVTATFPIITQLLAMFAARMERRDFIGKAEKTLKHILKLEKTSYDRTRRGEAKDGLCAVFNEKNYAILSIMRTVNDWVPSYSRRQTFGNIFVGLCGGAFIAIDLPNYPDFLGIPGLDGTPDSAALAVMGLSTLLVDKLPWQLGLISAQADDRKRLFNELKAYYENRFFILLTGATLPYLIKEMEADDEDKRLRKILERVQAGNERKSPLGATIIRLIKKTGSIWRR